MKLHEEDAGCCKLFVKNLSRPALLQFTYLEEGSIDNFIQLSTIFIKQYSMFIPHTVTDAHLQNPSQAANEPLWKYIVSFKENHVPDSRTIKLSDIVCPKKWALARVMFLRGTDRQPTRNNPRRISSNFKQINAEEEQATLVKKFRFIECLTVLRKFGYQLHD